MCMCMCRHVCVCIIRKLSKKLITLPKVTCNEGQRPRINGKIPWKRKCNPLQDFCLGNPMDRGAWWATVNGVTKSPNITERLCTRAHKMKIIWEKSRSFKKCCIACLDNVYFSEGLRTAQKMYKFSFK